MAIFAVLHCVGVVHARVYLKMGRTPKIEDWNLEAVQIMARSGCSLAQAVTELGMAITAEEINRTLKRPSFQKLLLEARDRHFSELGSDPKFGKDTIIGHLRDQARKLDEEGEHDKASEVLFKVAKMAGFVGPESTVNVFADLSNADLMAIREKITQQPSKMVN